MPTAPGSGQRALETSQGILVGLGAGVGFRKLAEAGLDVCLRGTPSFSTKEARCVWNPVLVVVVGGWCPWGRGGAAPLGSTFLPESRDQAERGCPRRSAQLGPENAGSRACGIGQTGSNPGS